MNTTLARPDRCWTGPKHGYYVRMDGQWTKIELPKVNFHTAFDEAYGYVRRHTERRLGCTDFNKTPTLVYWRELHATDLPDADGRMDLPFRNWPLFQKMLELDVRVNISNSMGPFVEGMYTPDCKLITLRWPKVGVWLHELAHAAENHLGMWFDEVVAEASSWVVRKMLGINCSEDHSAKYIARNLGSIKSKYQEMSKAKRSVKRVVQELLS